MTFYRICRGLVLLGVALMLAACGTSDQPLLPSNSTSVASPYPLQARAATATIPSPRTPSSSPTPQSTPTTTPLTRPQPAPFEATVKLESIGLYSTVLGSTPAALGTWSPDESQLLTIGSKSGSAVHPFATGSAFIFDLKTGHSTRVQESVVVGYLIGSIQDEYQQPEWSKSGIRLYTLDESDQMHVVQLDPIHPDASRSVIADIDHGVFHTRADGTLLQVDATGLKQPMQATTSFPMLSPDPQLARLTQLSDTFMIYAPTTHTLRIHDLIQHTESVLDLTDIPLDPLYRVDASLVNTALSPNGRYVAFVVGYRFAAAEIWVLDTTNLTVSFVEQSQFESWSYLYWSPDSRLLAYGWDGINLYDPVRHSVVERGGEPVLSLAWSPTSTKLAILAPGQKSITIYKVINL